MNHPRICHTLRGYLMAVLLIVTGGLAAQDHAHDEAPVADDAGIGTVSFKADCAEEVRADFDRALGLMHHMMYEQARDGFEVVAAADPDCAMAHWGIATTLFQPLWGTQPGADDLDRGLRHVELAAKRVTAGRERALIKATAAFFQGGSAGDYSLGERIEAWIGAMAEAHDAHPQDADVAALYGLALLARAQNAADPGPLHDKAEHILRGVFERVPDHPGAIHYSIHATDADGRAENALDMVAAYGQIAPEVPHALHMPTHIYVRLGDWPAVIDWNQRSAEAALKYPVGEAQSHHYVHAVDYLIYAYLQRGEDERAEWIYAEATDRGPHQASFISAFHMAAMPARLAVERRDWAAAAGLQPRSPDYLPWDQAYWPEAMSWYARGLGAVHGGDLETAETALERLVGLRQAAEQAEAGRMAAYIDIDRNILDGWIAHARGDGQAAQESMRAAAEIEAAVDKHPVSPGALMPPNEALGDLLMALDRPAQALEAYEASDRVWPGRYHTLLGAARAARAAGNDEAAAMYYRRLMEQAAESSRDGSAEARKFLEAES